MSILSPRVVALDSSHWAKWIAAYYSDDYERRQMARAFHQQMLQRNWIPFLSWHHLEELLALADDVVVQKRIMFLRNLSTIAWFRPLDDQPGIGSIIDITAAEALASCEGLIDPNEIVQWVKSRLLKFGSGSEAIGEEDWVWHAIHDIVVQRSERSRAIVAIAPFESFDDSIMLGELLKRKLATPDEIAKTFGTMAVKLTAEVIKKGDRRIRDPAGITTTFLLDVLKMAGRPLSVRDLLISTYIENGLELHELVDEMTIRDLNELATFRSKLKIIAPMTGRTFEELRRFVRMEQCPHWIINRDMQMHQPDLPERKGSDLADGHLATLAAYVDHLFVDRRTAETFRRLPKTCRTLSLTNSVSKAGKFEQILSKLE